MQPEEDGTFFIDRDFKAFVYILQYLRGGSLEGLQLTASLIELLNHDCEYYNYTELSKEVKKYCMEKRFIYVSDFDENGVMYWLGTRGKTKPYVNPCTDTSLVIATESHSQYGTGLVAFGRESGISNYAHQSNTNGTPMWFQIEFKSITVCPSYYSIRTDFNANHAIRNWKLEGSIDGKTWVNISIHNGDSKMPATANSCASWPVTVQKFFQFLRVTQTGPNSSGNIHFMMCGFEVYGRTKNLK